MDDDIESSMFLMRALGGPLAAMMVVMITMTVTAPVLLYVIARWRAHREPEVDGQLGVKFALHYFSLSAFQLALGGLAFFVFTVLSKIPSEFKGSLYRTAFGMIVPAAIVLGAHLALLRKTNDAEVTGVRRLFLGYNLIITGLVGFVALVIAFQALFMKGSSGELGRVAGALVVVYGTAWALIGWKFGSLVLGGGSGSGIGPVSFTSPPSSGTSAPPPAASGLPSLGGGSFPPIEQK
ncbi:MAG: hypothetical protein SFX73_28675 [Kofleriaceae bacterium]|nr:hypothetical protein [Kofleriaceae bacterium]